MEPGDKWLKEMIDSALNDPEFSEEKISFDFSAGKARRSKRVGLRLVSAAAILAVLILLPSGFFINRHFTARKFLYEQNLIFVDSLIGESIFEEDLVPAENGSYEWLYIFETENNTENYDSQFDI